MLHTLVADNCQITEISGPFAVAMGNLKTLKLRFNFIEAIPYVPQLQTLTHLDLSNNLISQFKPTINAIRALAYLEILDLRENPITTKFYAKKDAGWYDCRETIVRKISASDALPIPGSWKAVDRDFRREMKDKDFVRRFCYRSVLSKTNLKILDGLPFSVQEREMSDEYIKILAKRKQINL
ncbi:hypothetical protein HK100_012172 [Physocladia obscura]|uniref:Uncharacterized protein n=1 Tax=Physocladia obscura TaxID=109957 RepID=A0AAD5T1M9_9FUNG|nr:hypothetical protein HK100_012172 [Physocladia obscura]